MDVEKLKVMVAGHICLDITPLFSPDTKGNFSDIFSPGKLINVGQAVFSTGGAVANTGLAMEKLGIDVLLNGKIGDDEIGGLIKKLAGPAGAGSLRTVQGQNSSYSIVLALPGVDRVFLHNPGANDTFTAEDIDYEALKNCSLFHFGYPTLMKKFYENDGKELIRMFEQVKRTGVVTCLDMTLPDPHSPSGRMNWLKICQRLLPYVDIFLPSIEEIAYMLDRDLFETRKTQVNGQDPVLSYTGLDCSRLADKLLNLGVKIAAIKVGIKGYYLRTAGREVLKTLSPISAGLDLWSNREIWTGSYKVHKFGSATGAGDATIAGFLTAFLRGLTPLETVKAANLLGWQNVRRMDALSGIQDWPLTLAMIHDDQKQRNPLVINETGWRYCQSQQAYYGPSDQH